MTTTINYDWDITDVAQHLDTDINNARNIINKRKKAKQGCLNYITAIGSKKKNTHFKYNSQQIKNHFKDYPIQKKRTRNLSGQDDYDRPPIPTETQYPYNQLAYRFLTTHQPIRHEQISIR